jgi:hypothetical protein
MPPNRSKKGELAPLSDNASDIFSRILSTCGLTEQSYHLKIFLAWEQAVGTNISSRTAIQSYTRGILIVKAASPTWQHELMFLRRDIINKLNHIMGKRLVHELKVVCGHLPRPEKNTANVAAPPSEADYAVAKETSLPIADPELRAAFERLMAKDRRYKSEATQKPQRHAGSAPRPATPSGHPPRPGP